MPRVNFLSDGTEITAEGQETILQAALRSGIPHVHACGGRGRCSTCRVMILDGENVCSPAGPKEKQLIEKLGLPPQVRLACMTRCSGDIRLRRLVLDDLDRELAGAENQVPGASAGEEKTAAILFSDLRGFSAFADTVPAYDVIHLLNRHFYQAEKTVTEQHGLVSNHMGDGFLALFFKDAQEHPVIRAAAAALELLTQMQFIRSNVCTLYKLDIDIRLGIHFGELICGTVGTGKDSRMTAIGGAVNLASRIENYNKAAGTRLLVSGEALFETPTRIRTGKTFKNVQFQGIRGRHDLYEITGLMPKEG